MISDRKDRQAKNEVLSRALNERVHETTTSLDFKGLIDGELDRGEYLCECADITCTASISLSQAEYAEVRSDGIWFVIVPGHEVLDVESIVRSNERYAIVVKHPEEAAIARATDPARGLEA